MANQELELFTGIEIGTGSVKVAICSVADDYGITLLGWGEAPSLKVIKGSIKDHEFVAEQIARAIRKAEDEAGVDVQNTVVTLAIGTRLVNLVDTAGTVDFDGMSVKITYDHVVSANREASYYPTDDMQEVISEYTRYYSLKDRILLNPVGQVSTFITAHNHSVVVQKRLLSSYADIITSVLDNPPDAYAYAPMAIACAAFQRHGSDVSPEGCLLIDIGAGVTSYVLYTGEDFYTIGQITIGCDHAANDLAVAFALPIDSARKILRNFAALKCTAIPVADGRARLISVESGKLGSGNSEKKIPASSVEQIVQVRFHELFNIIDKKMEDEDAWQWATGGVLLSGGGAKIPKIAELASNAFRKPVSIARTVNVSGREEVVASPANLTPLGLVRFVKITQDTANQNNPPNTGGKLKNIWDALINW